MNLKGNTMRQGRGRSNASASRREEHSQELNVFEVSNTMDKNHLTCDPERIELFLAGELTGEEQTAFELHLDDCDDCRRRLEAAAARDDVWSGVRDALLGEQPSPGDLSLDSAADGDASFRHETVLKLLAPTDDDRMIGRLGTYEIAGVVGSGGMGVVLKAFDAALNRYVAIKALAPHLAGSGAARKRFSREARAAAAVVHENVIEIHGVAEAQGLPYLVMPYVRGPSLQRRLDDEGPLTLAGILRIGTQVAAGLAAAHAQGLVHRDVKPGNILLADGVERVKLTDFGLARAADDAALTRTGVIAGTPQYMSPEQARGESVDRRSDLFSLGAVLYAMCTGRAPFRAETSYGVLRRITDDEPRPIREINPDIPEWLCRIVDKLMSKQAGDRFESAGEVAELLEGCLAHVQQPTAVPLPRSRVFDEPPRGGSSRKPGAPRPASLFRRSRVFRLLTAAAFAFALVFAGVIVVLELDKGTVTINCEADDVPVRIMQGEDVVDKLTVGRDGTSVRIAAGHYRVQLSAETDRLVVKDGTFTLTRGKERVVTIERAEKNDAGAASARPSETSERSINRPLNGEQVAGEHVSILDAVRRFNEQQQSEHPDHGQPPLTDDELVASVRWSFVEANGKMEPARFDALKTIVDRRMMPTGWSIVGGPNVFGRGSGEPVRGWLIALSDESHRTVHVVRRRLLTPPADEAATEEAASREVDDPDGVPLAAAVEEFNLSHSRIDGKRQPPLTEDEVVAAIIHWKQRREEAPVTNRIFAAFQRIAETRLMPKEATFEIVKHFQPGDGFMYSIWSVRMVMRKSDREGGTYAYIVRHQFISTMGLAKADIRWGPVGENGIQAGVWFEPDNEEYASGQYVTPRFFYRSTGDKVANASFPRRMTRDYYARIVAVDAAGKSIPVDQDTGPAGPVGWIIQPFRFGARHEIRGKPILLGDVIRGIAQTVIRAKPGQSVRVHFVLPNTGNPGGKPLRTGEIAFSMAKPE